MLTTQRSLFARLRSRSRTGWIGVDIGSHSVKVAQLEVADGRTQIAEAAIIPFPDQAVLTAESLQTGWLTRILRDEVSRHRSFRGRAVACGLSMSVTEFRAMNIPPGSRDERRDMISQELSESADRGTGAVEFDFWDGYSSPDDDVANSVTNVLSVSGSLAAQVAESCQQSGLVCHVLDGGPFVLARAVALADNPSASSGPVAVLDWGHQTAHFAVIVDGQPAFSRMLKDCGVGLLTDAVGRSLGLPTEECHQLLSTCGVPDSKADTTGGTELQELVADLAVEPFSQLRGELEKTLAYLRSQRSDLVPSHLWLVGGGATIRNADARLGFDTGLAVARWHLPYRDTGTMLLEGTPVELLAQAAALSELGWRS